MYIDHIKEQKEVNLMVQVLCFESPWCVISPFAALRTSHSVISKVLSSGLLGGSVKLVCTSECPLYGS